MSPDAATLVAVAEAQLDQLIEKQRTIKTHPEVADLSRAEFVSLMVGAMVDHPPQGEHEFASLATVAVLAVDRLARLPRPQIGL